MSNRPRKLAPLSLGDLLDAAFRLYREQFTPLLSIGMLLYAPIAVLQILLLLTNGTLNGGVRFQAIPSLVGFIPGIIETLPYSKLDLPYLAAFGLNIAQFLIIQSLAVSALVYLAEASYTGRPASFGAASRASLHTLLVLTPALAVPLVLAGCMAYSATFLPDTNWLRFVIDHPGEIPTTLAMLPQTIVPLIMVLLLLFVYARCALVAQALVLEQRGPIDSLRRSWALTGRKALRVVAVVALVSLLTYLLITLPLFLLNMLLIILNIGDVYLLNNILEIVITLIGLTTVLPLQQVAYTLLYYDLRMRREGYDLQVVAEGQIIPPV